MEFKLDMEEFIIRFRVGYLGWEEKVLWVKEVKKLESKGIGWFIYVDNEIIKDNVRNWDSEGRW